MDDQRLTTVDGPGPVRPARAPGGRDAGRPGPGRIRLVAAGSALLAAVLGAGGCDRDAGQPVASGSTGAVPSSPAADPSSPASGAPDTPAVPPRGAPGHGPSECRIDQLAISLGQGGAATGHYDIVLLFRDIGGTACTLRGYPGVAGLDAKGVQVAQARRTAHGFVGGIREGSAPPQLEIAPGETVSAMVEGTNVPSGDATSCPQYHGLLVTPPDETHSVRLNVEANGCDGLQVHPVVEGSEGTQPPR